MDRVWLAHGATDTVAVELLIFGVAACGLAFLLRSRGTEEETKGDAQTAVVTLVVGVALVIGAFAVPQL